MNVFVSGAPVRPRPGVLPAAIASALRLSSTASGKLQAKGLTRSIFAASGTAILASALAIAPAHRAGAQQQQQSEQIPEEITVTGSRILRRDYEANAPITTIDQSTFQATGTVGVETVLNQLPQFVPAITQFTTTDVQETANNSIGGSFVSLRGLGPNRNLVLIDGKRAQPFNSQMFVDTNMIPSSAIQRVELITGGASAVYGRGTAGDQLDALDRRRRDHVRVDKHLRVERLRALAVDQHEVTIRTEAAQADERSADTVLSRVLNVGGRELGDGRKTNSGD